MEKLTSKIVGITAISVGITRAILVLEEFGIINSFSKWFFYFYLMVFVIGILAYIGGSK
jgi:hypothetical protein